MPSIKGKTEHSEGKDHDEFNVIQKEFHNKLLEEERNEKWKDWEEKIKIKKKLHYKWWRRRMFF